MSAGRTFKVNFSQELYEADQEEPIWRKPGQIMELGHAVISALGNCSTRRGEKLDEKYSAIRYDLLLRIAKAKGPIEITSEEREEIEMVICENYNQPIIKEQCKRMILNAPEVGEKKPAAKAATNK